MFVCVKRDRPVRVPSDHPQLPRGQKVKQSVVAAPRKRWKSNNVPSLSKNDRLYGHDPSRSDSKLNVL